MRNHRHIVLLLIGVMFSTGLFAQTRTIKFTGRDCTDQYHIPLSRVEVFNLDQLWQEVLYYPDTILVLGTTGVDDFDKPSGLQLRQNVPNPFDGTTHFSLSLSEDCDVWMEILDMDGKVVVKESFAALEAGTHLFRTTLESPQTYLLSASVTDDRISIKMINKGHGGSNDISHVGMVDPNGNWTLFLKNDCANGAYPFSLGDEMRYVGYADIDGMERTSDPFIVQLQNNTTVHLKFDVTVPTVFTQSISNVTQTTATCGGSVSDNGGAAVTARGVCWSTSQNPTVNDSHTTDGAGEGSFGSSITGLVAGNTYYVRAYATSAVGTAYGAQRSFVTTSSGGTEGQPCPNVATVADYDGNVYNTVKIGNQCWMKENLRTTHYSDGTSISLGGGSSETIAYRYYPNNNSSNVQTYGYLYNWKAVMYNSSSSSANPSGVQGICPTGWHVPSYAEWTQLIDYVSGQSQYVCGSNNINIAKALAATTGWQTSSTTCAVGNMPSTNNTTGFSAMPAGYYDGYTGNFDEYANRTIIWSSTEWGDGARGGSLYYNYVNIVEADNYKGGAASVRCVLDEDDISDGQPCPNAATVADHDGNVYNTVKIGNQCWTKENIRTTHYSDGTSISLGSGSSETVAYRYYPNNDSSNIQTYGYLYNWKAVMHNSSSSNTNPSGVQGICPTGWHVPSDAEWTQLTDYVGGQSQYVCGSSNLQIGKSLSSSTGWSASSNTCSVGYLPNLNNATGFSAMPAGSGGGTSGFGQSAYLWSATDGTSSGHSFGYNIHYRFAFMDRGNYGKGCFFSVRCVKD